MTDTEKEQSTRLSDEDAKALIKAIEEIEREEAEQQSGEQQQKRKTA